MDFWDNIIILITFLDYLNMFEKLLEFENNLQNNFISSKPDNIRLSDREINEKYVKGDVRIVTEQARYPLNQIKVMFESDSYERHPEFQRRHRWDVYKKSKLIESFIMNVPIPPVFLYEKDFSEYEVMDGLQRISAIIEFYENSYPLTGLEEWPELNGRKYNELPEQIRKGIDRRYLSSIILLKETAKTPEEARRLKELVFARINSGGAKLEDQEARNAQFPGKFNELIIALARNESFCEIFDIPQKTPDEDVFHNVISDDLRDNKDFSTMKDVETVLRFFALRSINFWNNTTFSKFLDEYSDYMTNVDEDLLNLYKKLFEQTISLAYSIFGERTFCLWKRNKQTDIFSWSKKPALFVYDAVMISLSYFVEHRDVLIKQKPNIIDDIKNVFETEEVLFNGRNTSKKVVQDRILMFKNFWKEHL